MAARRTRPSKKNAPPAAVERPGRAPDPAVESYDLRLYVAGQTPRSTAALANLKRLCDEHLAGRYRLEIIDLMRFPTLARDHQILAIPTLVRQLPQPLKKIIGDLSNTERTLVALDLQRSI
ncbi:MAG TPA: circadian clock KaiB family protein [Polyangiaceae bacterium]|nr:circadian clock KaiB family protein [Polyangiaceae bacterium]